MVLRSVPYKHICELPTNPILLLYEPAKQPANMQEITLERFPCRSLHGCCPKECVKKSYLECPSLTKLSLQQVRSHIWLQNCRFVGAGDRREEDSKKNSMLAKNVQEETPDTSFSYVPDATRETYLPKQRFSSQNGPYFSTSICEF